MDGVQYFSDRKQAPPASTMNCLLACLNFRQVFTILSFITPPPLLTRLVGVKKKTVITMQCANCF